MNFGSQDAGLDATGGAIIMKVNTYLLSAALLLPLSTSGVVAQEKEQTHPILNLDAQAYTEVDQDTVIITLQASRQSSEQSVVSKALSETVSAVLQEIKKQEKVKVSSGNYFVRPQHNKEGVITGWQGQSQLLLESTDMLAASELAAQYQDKMPVSNVSFTVSKKARYQAEQQLMIDVVEAFNQRAQTMVSALNYGGFEIKDMQLGSSGAVYRSPQAYNESMLMRSVASDSIPIESGTEDITLSLSGAIYLLDKK